MNQQSTGGQCKKLSKSPASLTYRSKCEEKDYPVTLLLTSYTNGNLAISLQTEANGYLEDFATITVNFKDELLSPNQAYLDINNVPRIDQFIEKNSLGKPAGREKCSGFCSYPLYEFDLSRCMEHISLANP